jgi:hypothetical protein
MYIGLRGGKREDKYLKITLIYKLSHRDGVYSCLRSHVRLYELAYCGHDTKCDTTVTER